MGKGPARKQGVMGNPGRPPAERVKSRHVNAVSWCVTTQFNSGLDGRKLFDCDHPAAAPSPRPSTDSTDCAPGACCFPVACRALRVAHRDPAGWRGSPQHVVRAHPAAERRDRWEGVSLTCLGDCNSSSEPRLAVLPDSAQVSATRPARRTRTRCRPLQHSPMSGCATRHLPCSAMAGRLTWT